jgi:hypothetical protein
VIYTEDQRTIPSELNGHGFTVSGSISLCAGTDDNSRLILKTFHHH